MDKHVMAILDNCKEKMHNTIPDWEKAINAFQKIWTPERDADIQKSIIELEEYMKGQEKQDKAMEYRMRFVMAANEGLKPGSQKEFDCPICGGQAYASRASNNGHLHARCDNCGIVVMQ